MNDKYLIGLRFDITEIAEGQDFFHDQLMRATSTKDVDYPPSETEDSADLHSVDPSYWIAISTTALPILASIVLLWQGKGRTIKLKRKSNGTTEEWDLRNVRDSAEVIEAWVRNDSKTPHRSP